MFDSVFTFLQMMREQETKTNSAPVMPVTFMLPGGKRMTKDMHINYNMKEVAALLAADLNCWPEEVI